MHGPLGKSGFVPICFSFYFWIKSNQGDLFEEFHIHEITFKQHLRNEQSVCKEVYPKML